MRLHWTERSIKDFLFRITADIIAQLEKKMELKNISQDELAKRLKITKGRVSQVLNHPGNMSLAILVKYARALGMKMSIIAYEDSDLENIKGPVNSEIFKICWESCGKPHDFWELQEIAESKPGAANVANNIRQIDTTQKKTIKVIGSDSAVDATLPIYPFQGSS
jgi:transcriptional regulator with XRE-family HTH domain